MSNLPEGFDFQGIYCYQSQKNPSKFFYIPGEPTPETDSQENPTLMLWVSDKGAMLQFGTRWVVNSAMFEELREHIAERFGIVPVLVQLSPALVAIKGVTLSISDGEGNFNELQTVSSSGYSPFTALFNLQLTAEQKAQAVAALNGRQGLVRVCYEMSLPVEISIETEITGNVKEDIAALGKSPSLTECLSTIESAIAAGRLTLKQSGATQAPEELRQKSIRLAKDKAAAVLQRMARGIFQSNQSTLKAIASLTETVALPIERSTDVSSWFPKGEGADYIKVLPSPLPEPDEPPPSSAETRQTVRLGFETKDMTHAIAFIQLTQGDTKTTLRAPDFQPISLSAEHSDKPLIVKTYYTDSGQPFEVTLSSPEPEGWLLSAKDLGLAKVVVNGSARGEAGARDVQVKVHYIPNGKGIEDETTISLRRDNWIAKWYIVTRSAELNGVLKYEWKETTFHGSVVSHPSATTDKPELTL